MGMIKKIKSFIYLTQILLVDIRVSRFGGFQFLIRGPTVKWVSITKKFCWLSENCVLISENMKKGQFNRKLIGGFIHFLQCTSTYV